MNNLKEIIIATLFVAGDGVEKSAIAEKLEISSKQLDKVIAEIKESFGEDSGIVLIEYKNKVQLCTNQ